MVKSTINVAIIILASLLIFACNFEKQVDLEVELNVTLDGKPAYRARVLFDGNEIGSTDTNGRFSQRLKKQPGEEVRISVQTDVKGYRIFPWEDSFVTKLPKNRAVETYTFKAELQATKYFTVFVDDEDGELLEGATIRIADKTVGETDESGEYVHEYTRTPKNGLKLHAAMKGYGDWKKSVRIKPGQRYEVTLKKKRRQTAAKASPPSKTATQSQQSKSTVASAPAQKPAKKAARPTTKKATISIAALTEAYGVSRGIAGVGVSINGKPVGKTNAAGEYTYKYKGPSQKEARLTLSAADYIPERWETTIRLQDKSAVKRYFYPAAPKPIKVGIYGFVSNSPDEDLSDIIGQIEAAVSNNLFAYGCFHEVPKPQLREMMLQAGLDMETVSTKGYQGLATYAPDSIRGYDHNRQCHQSRARDDH
jgi:hypothetical protein